MEGKDATTRLAKLASRDRGEGSLTTLKLLELLFKGTLGVVEGAATDNGGKDKEDNDPVLDENIAVGGREEGGAGADTFVGDKVREGEKDNEGVVGEEGNEGEVARFTAGTTAAPTATFRPCSPA